MQLENLWKKVKSPTSQECKNEQSFRECVSSKYFTGTSGVDESLSDFQDPKPSCSGPKPVQKPNKTNKRTKRIKGQKDIRTALKGKKNDLVAYTKEFDTVCKKSGLDVDSEQLQLAIALSKSIQTEPSDNLDCSEPLPTQARVAKIRKTLQEYGFKVPEVKITNKRGRKTRKHYKLLTITEEERHQIVSAKYSEVLLDNLNATIGHNNYNNQETNFNLFDIATNIPYEYIKDSTIYYVEDLVEKSTTNGCILRDWAEIPGRPVSPKLLDSEIMNTVIDCSEDELDIVLSGPIKLTKDIMACNRNKKANNSDIPEVIIDVNEDIINNCEENEADYKGVGNKNKIVEVTDIQSPVKELEILDVHNPSTQYRSCSPDIFDDELSSVMETSKPLIVLSQEHKTKVFADNYMDLTECANIISQKSDNFPLSQNKTKRKSNDFMEITECVLGLSQPILEASQEIDLTQSPENKTENHDVCNNGENTSSLNHEEQNSYSLDENVTCIQNKEQTNKLDTENVEDIDLTQSSNEDGNIKVAEVKKTESMDLTQSSNSNDIDDLPLVSIGNTQPEVSLDDTIIVNEEEYKTAIKSKKSIILGAKNRELSEILNVSQDAKNNTLESDNSSIDETNEKSYNGSIFEEYKTAIKGEQSIILGAKNRELCEIINVSQNYKNATLESDKSSIEEINEKSYNGSIFEEYEHNHSEDSDIITHDSDLNDDNDKSSHNTSKEPNDIDLTQSSGNSEDNLPSIPNNSSLGKKDDVSIDYDEINTNSIRSDKNNSEQKIIESSESETDDIEIVDDKNEPEINSSQNSEVFNISDKEFDYSLHQSRHELHRHNFDFGGISIMDNITNIGSFRKSTNEVRVSNVQSNCTMSDSFLPEVKIKKSIINETTPESKRQFPEIPSNVAQDIFNSNSEEISIRTPKNSEYIIKTNNVTPMADYASMSTPQMNRELDKYGLKPFKRKRAIKILTHLYNQTHPTIQQLIDEDQPSPKKPRIETNTNNLTPKKFLISPISSPKKKQKTNPKIPPPKNFASPVKTVNVAKNTDKNKGTNNVEPFRFVDDVNAFYEVTSEVAVIKGVDCNPEDWVFQKREKAKVHSCRVPLHIAFHNYVCSRQGLREAILRYEPVNIDVIHKDLVSYGHRYDPKDLLKFLDKKCITVKTTDNNSRNNKR